MRVAVWKTPHEIATNVAKAVQEGLPSDSQFALGYNPDIIREYDAHIAYGILRGIADVFRDCNKLGKPWLHLDRGYFHPGHFLGYYRVSLRGTQQTGGWPEPDYERLERLKLDIKPWRGFDHSKPVLVCPPTDAVKQFFGTEFTGWLKDIPIAPCPNAVLRQKGDPTPINFTDYNYVLTFNSSVGWQALQAGIPCISDPTHSIVGTWFADAKLTETLSERQEAERMNLFATMAALQLTLEEIRAGRLWELLQNLLTFSSAETVGNPSAPASLNTQSASAPTLQSRFTTLGTGS